MKKLFTLSFAILAIFLSLSSCSKVKREIIVKQVAAAKSHLPQKIGAALEVVDVNIKGDMVEYVVKMAKKNRYKSEGTFTMYSGKEKVMSFRAVSGSGGSKPSYTLPSGDYSVVGIIDRTDPRFIYKNVGFTAALSPDPFFDSYAGRYRELIRIHPARYDGTLGCIGLRPKTAYELRQVRKLIGYTLTKSSSIPVSVTITGR